MASSVKPALYIHIPFCVSRCRYCDFYSISSAGTDLYRKVLQRLIIDVEKEMDEQALCGFSTIFIGGGTPSLLPVDLLHPFFSALNSLCGEHKEFTVEANPESLSEEFIALVSEKEVNRLSLGVQTYDNHLLNWLGRPADAEGLHRAEDMLARCWKGRLNRDLLAALPGDSRRLRNDILRASGGGHISVYELTVEPGTLLSNDVPRLAQLPNQDWAHHEWQLALKLLEELGYKRYEVSNFAKDAQYCRHNMAYWRLHPYLGIGPSASSTLNYRGRALRRRESPDVIQWLGKGPAAREEEILNAQDFAFEHFLTGLRIDEGLNLKNFEAIFGMDPLQATSESLERWIHQGMLYVSNGHLKASPEGLDLLDAILRDLLPALKKAPLPPDYQWQLHGI